MQAACFCTASMGHTALIWPVLLPLTSSVVREIPMVHTHRRGNGWWISSLQLHISSSPHPWGRMLRGDISHQATKGARPWEAGEVSACCWEGQLPQFLASSLSLPLFALSACLFALLSPLKSFPFSCSGSGGSRERPPLSALCHSPFHHFFRV